MGYEMLSLRLLKDVSRRSKTIAQLNNKDAFSVSLFTGEGSKTDEGGSQEIKAREWGELGTGSGRFWPSCSPLPPPPPFLSG